MKQGQAVGDEARTLPLVVGGVDDHEAQSGVLEAHPGGPSLPGRRRPLARRHRWSVCCRSGGPVRFGGFDDSAVHAIGGLVGETDGGVAEAGGGEPVEVFLLGQGSGDAADV